MKNLQWYEVWADEGIVPPYVLILLCQDEGGGFEIFDPLEKKNVFCSDCYQKASYWLLEDEYILVRGRMKPDD